MCRIARNVHFTGREEELRDLKSSLSSDQPQRRVAVICGLGGIGKTQLALELSLPQQGSVQHRLVDQRG